MISLLVAMDQNRVIGLNNDMPWHLPKDLKFFKQKTVGHTIVMGRKTFNSIGRVLPNRKHVILTRNKNVTFPEGVEVIYDISGIKDLDNNHPNDELFVIGGGKVFVIWMIIIKVFNPRNNHPNDELFVIGGGKV